MADEPRFKSKMLNDLDASFRKPEPPPAELPKAQTPPPEPPKAPVVEPPKAPATPAPDHDALLDDLIDGKPPAPTTPATPEPPKPTKPDESVGIKNLRTQYEKVLAELEQARTATKPLTDEINALKTKLASFDVQYDPAFAQKYDAPLAASRSKLLNVARQTGLDAQKAEALLSRTLAEAANELKDLPPALQTLVLNIHTEYGQHAAARQEALAQAPVLAQQLAEQRKAQQEEQTRAALALRNSVFRDTVKAVVRSDKRFNVADEAQRKAVGEAVQRAAKIVEGDPTAAPSEAAAGQIAAIFKGSLYDVLAAEHDSLKAKYEELVTAARARGIAVDTASGATPPPKPLPNETPADFNAALAAQRAGKFKPGGELDLLSKRR